MKKKLAEDTFQHYTALYINLASFTVYYINVASYVETKIYHPAPKSDRLTTRIRFYQNPVSHHNKPYSLVWYSYVPTKLNRICNNAKGMYCEACIG